MSAFKDSPLVIAGVDDSPDAAVSARWALELLAPREPRLRLVHVPTGGETASRAPDWLCRLVRALSADVLVTQPPPGCPRGADVAAALADVAHGADLIVVGSWGEGAGGGMKVGSTALELLDRAPCPVAVVRGVRSGEAPDGHGPVVIGYDPSPTGDAALALAAGLAEAAKAPLLILHVWSELATDPVGGSYRVRESWDARAQQAAALVDDVATAVQARHPGVEVQRRVIGDTPLRALLDAADGARVVVVGQRRTHAISHRHLGSTSRGLVEFAPCPMVVVPPVEPGTT